MSELGEAEHSTRHHYIPTRGVVVLRARTQRHRRAPSRAGSSSAATCPTPRPADGLLLPSRARWRPTCVRPRSRLRRVAPRSASWPVIILATSRPWLRSPEELKSKAFSDDAPLCRPERGFNPWDSCIQKVQYSLRASFQLLFSADGHGPNRWPVSNGANAREASISSSSIWSSSDLMSILGPGRRFRLVNAAFQSILGMGTRGVDRSVLPEFHPSDDLERVSAAFDSEMESRPASSSWNFANAVVTTATDG